MNHCIIHEDIRSSVTVNVTVDRRDSLVCPKPRRLGVFNAVNDHPSRSLRWQISHHADFSESKSGTDLLDMILTKGGYSSVEQQSCTQIASSPPPFFCGSPPSRVANPLIQDARFGEEKISPMSPIQPPSGLPSSPTSANNNRKGGCVRANFGNKPAVRVEGFDCLDRDRRNCTIPTFA
ncbi:hypothetical protein ACFE04_018418 [Oxalis oulophora]